VILMKLLIHKSGGKRRTENRLWMCSVEGSKCDKNRFSFVCWELQISDSSLVTDLPSSFRAFDSLLIFIDHMDFVQRFHELQTQDVVQFTRPDIGCLLGTRKLVIVFARAQFVWLCLFLA
jgi:hypothetical protein